MFESRIALMTRTMVWISRGESILPQESSYYNELFDNTIKEISEGLFNKCVEVSYTMEILPEEMRITDTIRILMYRYFILKWDFEYIKPVNQIKLQCPYLYKSMSAETSDPITDDVCSEYPEYSTDTIVVMTAFTYALKNEILAHFKDSLNHSRNSVDVDVKLENK